MNVQVNMVAVLLSAAASMVLGMIWYAKPVFGKMWMELTGLNEKKLKSGSTVALVQGLVGALLTSYVLAHLIFLANKFYGNSFMQDALATALWVAIGISCTTVIIHNGFEQRRKKLTLLTVAHQIVGFLIMGAIIGAFRP